MDARLAMPVALLLGSACTPSPDEPAVLDGTTMGTTWRVQLVGLPPGLALGKLRAQVERIVTSIDERMSTYEPDSELSRFNASESTGWFGVTADTQAVVDVALRVGRLSHGAFDVTIGPLVECWGFGPGAGPPGGVPDEADIAAAREHVGPGLLETRPSPPALRKLDPQLGVDLSALAKGHAIDAVARHLDEAGVSRYLVEIGGELRGRGLNPGGLPWRVALEVPPGSDPVPSRVVSLMDRAIATSGDYRRAFGHEGRRYSHILDPRTGRPAGHGVASATVLAPTAMEADAFATALMVLAPEEGLELAEELGLDACLLVREDGGLRTLTSSGFEAEVLP